MRAIRNFAVCLMVTLVIIPAAHGQSARPSASLPNFYKVNEALFRGGQPTDEGIRQLANLGIRTVIDLRGGDERAQREGVVVEAAGMRFINLPLPNWSRPDDQTAGRILTAIQSPENQPVFVHCKRGSDRTGTTIAIYRIVHDGWTAKHAEDEAKQRGFGWWQFQMKDYIGDFYRDLKAGKTRLSRPEVTK